jgi:hypothetical protein
VTFRESVKPADVGASNRLQKHAHLGNPRTPLAITLRPNIQRAPASDSFVRLDGVAARILARIEEARRR